MSIHSFIISMTTMFQKEKREAIPSMSYWLLHRTDHVDVHGSALIACCHLKGDWYCGITDQGCMASDNNPFGGNLVERKQWKKVRRAREMNSERREDGFNGSL